MHPQVVRLTPPRLSDVDLFATDVQAWEVQDVPLALPAEVATFATDKRREEHLSGRWLLGQALKQWGVDDLSVLEVVRDEHRAPSLAYIHGVWKRTPLPNISIAHSEGTVFVALIDERLSVGFDAEPLERTLAENAYDMMAKGGELERLRASPSHVFQAWTGKEAVQKCLGLGMHLNPRHIQIPIGKSLSKITIGNSKIQLDYWQENGYHCSLATGPAKAVMPTPEDRLLEATRSAMEADPDWGVGCKTARKNA
jgi:phosphopantetheinyl transferase